MAEKTITITLTKKQADLCVRVLDQFCDIKHARIAHDRWRQAEITKERKHLKAVEDVADVLYKALHGE